MKSFKKFLSKHNLLPSYQEETPFLILLSLCVIALVDPTMRAGALVVLQYSPKSAIGLGIFYIIYTTFFSYFLSVKHKYYIFFFSLIVNGWSVWTTSEHLLANKENFLSIVILLINALILLVTIILWLFGKLDTDTIPNRSAQYINIFYGSIVVTVLILIGKYGLDFSWPTLFSMSVGYAILFNKKFLERWPEVNSKRKLNMDSIENMVARSIEIFKKDLEDTGASVPFCIIITERKVRKVYIPSQYHENVELFFERELAQEDRTEKFVAVIWYTDTTHKKFLRKKIELGAYVINIYPNTRKRGYQFQYFLNTGKDYALDEKIVYADRIKNHLMNTKRESFINKLEDKLDRLFP